MAAAQNIRNREKKQSRFLPPAAFCVRGHLVFASYRIVAVMYFSCAKIVHLCDATKHFAYFLHFAVRRKRPNRDILCLRSEGVKEFSIFNLQSSIFNEPTSQCSMFKIPSFQYSIFNFQSFKIPHFIERNSILEENNKYFGRF